MKIVCNGWITFLAKFKFSSHIWVAEKWLLRCNTEKSKLFLSTRLKYLHGMPREWTLLDIAHGDLSFLDIVIPINVNVNVTLCLKVQLVLKSVRFYSHIATLAFFSTGNISIVLTERNNKP